LIPAYRVTPEDLPDADQKTKSAIRPLLERLNRSLGLVITALNALSAPAPKTTTFITDALGGALVTLGNLERTPAELWQTALTPQTGTLTSGITPAWIPTTNGARLTYAGLSADTTYSVTLRYL
jgi:hypothetical protein